MVSHDRSWSRFGIALQLRFRTASEISVTDHGFGSGFSTTSGFLVKPSNLGSINSK